MVFAADNITLDCRGNKIQALYGVSFTTSWMNAIIHNCIFLSNNIAINGGAYQTQSLTAYNNVFLYSQGFSGNGPNMAFTNNTFRNTGYYGMLFSYNPSNQASISYNNFHNVSRAIEDQACNGYLSNADIHHNLFNDSGVYYYGNNGNTWNTSTAGNYYVATNGSGYSQFCVDDDTNNVCDSSYILPGGCNAIFDTDYLPLTYGQTPQNITPTTNEAPLLNARFLGVDQSRENFVFSLAMSDAEGGAVYQASDVVFQGNVANGTSIESMLWDNPGDVSLVTVDAQQECPTVKVRPGSYVNFTDGTSIKYSGSLIVNNTCNNTLVVLIGADVATPEIDFPDGGILNIKNSFSFFIDYYNAGGETGIGTWELIDQNGASLGELIFYRNPTTQNYTISFYQDGVETVLNASPAFFFGEGIWVDVTIDFTNKNATYVIGPQMTVTTQPIPQTTTGIRAIAVNRYIQYNYGFIMGSVSFNFVVQTLQPGYIFFATLAGGVDPITFAPLYPLAKAVYLPIDGAFGQYQLIAYGTDDAHGLNYYVDPYVLTFNYDVNTKVLTPSEISALVEARNQGFNQTGISDTFVPGDIVTDLMANLFNLLGFKSQGSRFLLGLILLGALTFMLAGFGSEIIIFFDMIALIVFAYIGLFPLWFVILLVIIAAALIAVATRRVTMGK